MPGQDRKDRGADEIEDQVEARTLAEQAELRRRVGGEDEQGAGYLDRLIDWISLRRRTAHLGNPRRRTVARTTASLCSLSWAA
jgi:hypothetical protein